MQIQCLTEKNRKEQLPTLALFGASISEVIYFSQTGRRHPSTLASPIPPQTAHVGGATYQALAPKESRSASPTLPLPSQPTTTSQMLSNTFQKFLTPQKRTALPWLRLALVLLVDLAHANAMVLPF